MFLVPVVVLAMLASVTVSVQALGAATANPIDSLKNE